MVYKKLGFIRSGLGACFLLNIAACQYKHGNYMTGEYSTEKESIEIKKQKQDAKLEETGLKELGKDVYNKYQEITQSAARQSTVHEIQFDKITIRPKKSKSTWQKLCSMLSPKKKGLYD